MDIIREQSWDPTRSGVSCQAVSVSVLAEWQHQTTGWTQRQVKYQQTISVAIIRNRPTAFRHLRGETPREPDNRVLPHFMDERLEATSRSAPRRSPHRSAPSQPALTIFTRSPCLIIPKLTVHHARHTAPLLATIKALHRCPHVHHIAPLLTCQH